MPPKTKSNSQTKTEVLQLMSAATPSEQITVLEAPELEINLLDNVDLDGLVRGLAYPAGALTEYWQDQLKREYIRFIVMKVYLGDIDADKISPPNMIDQLWHAHILESKSYIDMCRKLCKVDYIHHRSSGAHDGQRSGRLRFAAGAYAVLWPKDVRENPVRDFGDINADHNVELFQRAATPALPRPISLDRGTPNEAMKLSVITLTGKRLVIWSALWKSVHQLKMAILREEGIPFDQQRLIFEGKQLEGERRLSEYALSHESTIFLVLRLTGC